MTRQRITNHYHTDLARRFAGDVRFWERGGNRLFNTPDEREGYTDLLMVGYDSRLIEDLWMLDDFAVHGPTIRYRLHDPAAMKLRKKVQHWIDENMPDEELIGINVTSNWCELQC